MATPKYDFSARQGDTFTKSFAWKDSNGAPYDDLTNYLFEFAIAPSPGSKPQFQYLTPDFVVNGPNAEFVLTIPFTETRKWPSSRLHYELTLTSPSDFRITILTGRLRVSGEIVL
jgi:hypothetical protein